MSETIDVPTAAAVGTPELSIAFSTEELVVLARVLGLTLGVLGAAPLAAIAPSARDDVLASAARSLRARNVLTGPPDLPAVDRAVAGLIQIAARPALRAELAVDRGAVAHRRYLCIPYASVEHEVTGDGLHRLTPFATADLLARAMRQADFAERPVVAAEGFDVAYATLAAARDAVAGSDPARATEVLVGADIAAASASAFVAALAALVSGGRLHAIRVRYGATPTRTEGGEIAWLDGGDAGLWRMPTLDQPFAELGNPLDHLDGASADPDRVDDALAAAVVRVEPVAATDLAAAVFGLLPSPSG